MVWRTIILRCKNQSGSTVSAAAAATTKVVKFPKDRSGKLYRESNFIDRVRMKVFGGPGGSGYPKINGVGGRGGDVYVQAVENIELRNLLSTYPDRRVKGGPGENSRPHVLLGQAGKDVVIEVPLGVTVTDSGNRQLADLVQSGDKFLVAKGGQPGTPRNGFVGRKGTESMITLYLKLIADIGFVGFPNAGKSTLLRSLSRARPKVANYPFTTLRPNVGTMEFEDFRQITLADLPGLIEGAHLNAGLGYNFLRHVERTSLLMFVVDIGGFCLNERSPHRNAFETVMSLNKELEMYRSDLVHKPALLVVNKMDTENANEKAEEFAESMNSEEAFENLPDDLRPTTRINFKETVHISAKNMENIDTLKKRLRCCLDDLEELKRAQDVTNDIELPRLVDQLM